MNLQSRLLTGFIASLISTGAIAAPANDTTETITLKTVKVEADALGNTTEHTDSYTTGSMNTATKMDLSIRETPQSVSVITNTQLEDLNITTINDALETATGITVRRAETDRTYFEARGFDINNFQVDGVGTPLHWDLLEGDIDMALYDRIEIVRGASGLMSGLGNPSATINLVRKRPTADTQASASLSHARWNDTRVVLDGSTSLSDRVRVRAVASDQQKDSYLQDYHKDLSTTYGIIETDLGTNTLLSAGISRLKSEADSPMWGALTLTYEVETPDGIEVRPTRFKRSLSSSADWAYWDVKETKSFIELDHTYDNGWNTKATYSRTKTVGAQELLYIYGTLKEDFSGLGGWAGKFNRHMDFKQLDVATTGNFSTGNLEHKFVVGVNHAQGDVNEFAYYDYTTGNGFPPIPNMAEWTGDTPRPTFTSIDPANKGEFVEDKQTGFYVAGQFSLTEKLKLLTGARDARYRSEGESYSATKNTNDDVLVPYAGFTYDINNQFTAYTSYAETFNVQTEEKLSGERLDPTAGVNKEIGLKGEFFDDTLNLTIAAFETSHENLAKQIDFNDDPEAGPIGFYYGGVDYVSKGFEFEIAGDITDNINLMFGYTNLMVDDDKGEVARTFVPKQSAKLAASYTPEWLPRLKVGSFLEYRAKTYARNTVIKQDALYLIDAFARYEINDHLNIAINMSNITDETYYGGGLEYNQAYYAEPRNISASIRWDY